MVAATAALRTPDTVITADAGYHSEANLTAVADAGVTVLIAVGGMRQRDERYATQGRYTTRPDPRHATLTPARNPLTVFGPEDCTYDPVARTCVCPAGQSLDRTGGRNVTGDHVGAHCRGATRDCGPCALRVQCLRTPEPTPVRHVAFCH